MILKPLKPKLALNKAFLKIKPIRSEFDIFKASLITLLNHLNPDRSEEYHKNLISKFLTDSYYKNDYFINVKDRQDLVIHNGSQSTNTVGVMIEAKHPAKNPVDMVTINNLNTKAFHELMLYYLRERITHKNLEIKHLIATNINEWFIFEATTFERLFAQNKQLVQQFHDFENGRLADFKTEFFYQHIAYPFLTNLETEISFTYFNLQDYQNELKNAQPHDDKTLIALFKLLSPTHLLKLPITNDSNSLDKQFYHELLHIIGLTETKIGSKKRIERNPEGQRHLGTLIENAIVQLESLDKLNRLPNIHNYGSSTPEQLFNVALELSITWINRILFLKLLEAQLILYNNNALYAFLSFKSLKLYEDLNSLFFQVLARQHHHRNDDVKHVFDKVPYLNSSLFEPTEIEQLTLFISNLKDNLSLPILPITVLKDGQGRKRTGTMNALQYLFEFLNAYDFGSEDANDIQEQRKTLINASVLGLIFEKINGYKEGSFFTPGFITMYMCRETIRKAVLQKFNETKHWQCGHFDELYNKIDDIKEANSLVNSLKICDPAVGSGHFLVSALNEIIAIKHDLKILQDKTGKRLKEYQVFVENDELVITDDNGELFQYKPFHPESQRVQETLFHEKQTIIEHCLFGVDINTNSVKICRLRLWIELLKHAYYKNATELETLPNIDINIKCGNSLVSRYGLDVDLKQVLKKSKWTIQSYQMAVDTYRNAENKAQKREMESLILSIKQSFTTEISMNNPFKTRLDKLANELYRKFTGTFLFEPQPEYDTNNGVPEKKRLKEQEKLEAEIKDLNTKIDDLKSNKMFEHAFEWRFEFPEVLNKNGDFIGFDVVIGNPPYIDSETMVNNGHADLRTYLTNTLKYAKGNWDIYIPFYEIAFNLLNTNGYLAFITPDKWISKPFGFELRKHLIYNIQVLCEAGRDVFDSALVDSIIMVCSKQKNKKIHINKIDENNIQHFSIADDYQYFSDNEFCLDWLFSPHIDLLKKIDKNPSTLQNWGICDSACATSDAYELIPFIYNLKSESEFDSNQHLKIINTGTIDKFIDKWGKKEMTYLKSKYYFPVVNKIKFLKHFGNSYGKKATMPKLVIKGLTLLDATIDLDGTYIPGKSTLIFSSVSVDKLKLVLALLNSKLCLFYIKEKYRGSSYNQGINFTKLMINSLPLPKVNDKNQAKLIALSNQILQLKKTANTTALESKIDELVYKIYDLSPEEINIVEENV